MFFSSLLFFSSSLLFFSAFWLVGVLGSGPWGSWESERESWKEHCGVKLVFFSSLLLFFSSSSSLRVLARGGFLKDWETDSGGAWDTDRQGEISILFFSSHLLFSAFWPVEDF